MLRKFLQIKQAYQVNVLYTPLLMLMLFSVGALFMVWLDNTGLMSRWFGTRPWFSNQTAHQVLGIIATSVITIISVVFSISILTLSMAANLLGPRLIPNFIRKGQTQFVIGVYTGTFVYSLVILASMEKYQQVPQLSVMIGIILSFVSFIVLIYFIHFVCQNIQVEYTLAAIMRDLKSAIAREFQKESVKQPDSSTVAKWLHTMHVFEAINDKPGYIQAIDFVGLSKWAAQHDIVVKTLYKPGDFVISGVPVVQVYAKGRLKRSTSQSCLSYFKIGQTRTPIQDVEFCFEQIAEIALRALSPGINNPYTAMLCINYLSEGVRHMSQFYEPTTMLMVDDKLVLIAYQTNYEGVTRKAFDRLRQQAKEDLSVTIKLLEMIADLCKHQDNLKIAQFLQKQAEFVYKDSLKYLENESDRADLDSKFEAIKIK